MSTCNRPTGGLAHVNRPCSACPWRTDAVPQAFPAERYEALAETSPGPHGQPRWGAPLFACHMTKEGREQACAGWLAVHGADHLGVRLAVVTGRLDAAALAPGQGWPDLHADYDALVAHQGYDNTQEMTQ